MDTETIRERGVNLLSLGRDPMLLLLREELQRAHVVQTIAQLNEHHPDIFRHSEKHLPKILGLLLLFRLKLDSSELRHSLNDISDPGAKLASEILTRYVTILDRVVEKRRNY